MKAVLAQQEAFKAKLLSRKPEPITDDFVKKGISDCDKNRDGKISREEMQKWLLEFNDVNNNMVGLDITHKQSEEKTAAG